MKTNTSHKYEIVPWLRRAASFGTNYENLSASSSSADEQVAEEAPSTDYAESLEGDSAFGKSHQAPLTRYPQNFCCSINFSWKTNISLIMLACVTMVMLLLIAAPGVCPHNPEAVFRPLLDPTSNGVVTDAMKKKKIFNILFYGDSMLSAPIQRYDLFGRISRYLPSYQFSGKASAYSGTRMTNLRRNLPSQLSGTTHYDGIILMCDSDITDVKFDTLTDQKRATLLSTYTIDLLSIIHAAQNASIPIAVSSPVGVLLEGRLGAPDSVRYHHKVEAVAAYTAATKAAAESSSIPYVDIRSATLAAIPFYRQYYLGCVTYDGEHPNEFGTEIFAKLYARVLNQWFYESLTA